MLGNIDDLGNTMREGFLCTLSDYKHQHEEETWGKFKKIDNLNIVRIEHVADVDVAYTKYVMTQRTPYRILIPYNK